MDKLLDVENVSISFIQYTQGLNQRDLKVITDLTLDISEGEILKIRPDGILERNTFEYSYYYGRGWWDYGSFSSISLGNGKAKNTQKEYLESLKSIASYQGYSPEDVDELIVAGFTLDEIEDYLYAGGEI